MPNREKMQLQKALISLGKYCAFFYWVPFSDRSVHLSACSSLTWRKGMTVQTSLSYFGLKSFLLHCWFLCCWPLALDVSFHFQHFIPFVAALSPQHSFLISANYYCKEKLDIIGLPENFLLLPKQTSNWKCYLVVGGRGCWKQLVAGNRMYIQRWGEIWAVS